MPEVVSHCPLCESTESAPFDERVFRKLPVTNRICGTCGLVFQSPRMNAAELERFYEAEYRRLYSGQEGPPADDLRVQRKRAEGLLAFLRRAGGAAGEAAKPRHLDIGCSAGLLLLHFAEALGMRPLGVEPGQAYRDYARAQGLEVFSSLEELEEAGAGRFDLVSLIHVLEHLPDPVAYLAHAREHLVKDTGLLLLETPNLYAHDSFEVAHLTAFSGHTLGQVVQRAGYEIVRLEKHGRPRSRLLPLYLTLLARPARPASLTRTFHLRPERGVAAKRRLGMLRRRIVQRLFPRLAWLPK